MRKSVSQILSGRSSGAGCGIRTSKTNLSATQGYALEKKDSKLLRACFYDSEKKVEKRGD